MVPCCRDGSCRASASRAHSCKAPSFRATRRPARGQRMVGDRAGAGLGAASEVHRSALGSLAPSRIPSKTPCLLAPRSPRSCSSPAPWRPARSRPATRSWAWRARPSSPHTRQRPGAPRGRPGGSRSSDLGDGREVRIDAVRAEPGRREWRDPPALLERARGRARVAERLRARPRRPSRGLPLVRSLERRRSPARRSSTASSWPAALRPSACASATSPGSRRPTGRRCSHSTKRAFAWRAPTTAATACRRPGKAPRSTSMAEHGVRTLEWWTRVPVRSRLVSHRRGLRGPHADSREPDPRSPATEVPSPRAAPR